MLTLTNDRFVDCDMYIRYLGGGVGHLEQFPPASNDDGIVYEYEAENEDALEAGGIKNNGSGHDNEETEDEDEDGERGEDEDEDSEGGEDDSEDEDEDEDTHQQS